MIMLYMKAIICSLDGDADFFDFFTDVLQADNISTMYVYYLYYSVASIARIKENGFTHDLALRENKRTQTESLLYSLEQTSGGINPYRNANKTEFMF